MKIATSLFVVMGLIWAGPCLIGVDWANAAPSEKDLGLPIYPGTKPDPKYPSLDKPQLKNIHLLTSDPFDKVVEWYRQKLGRFRVTKTPNRGNHALWREDIA